MLSKISKLGMAMLAISIGLTSCSDDEEMSATAPSSNNGELRLNIIGLEDLGDDYRYEGWIIVNGAPVTTGLFDVNDQGELSQTEFALDQSDLDNATAFVLTIEPNPDSDPAPSDVHILAGDFGSDDADLTVGHDAALGNDFTTSAGGYILATPTDADNSNEYSGVWFLNPAQGPGPALDLPTLPAGWAYEGWAVIDGNPVSTGTFTSVSGADDAAIYSGPMDGPPFPGEDFLQSAPAGLSFPTDLSGAPIVISIEPVPDNSPAPFTLKPLAGASPMDALDHTFYTIDQNLMSFPSGTALR